MFKKILVSVDLDSPFDWDRTLPVATSIAQQWGAALEAMTVIPDYGKGMVSQFFPTGYEDKVVKMTMDRLREQVDSRLPDGLKASHLVGEGNIYEALLQTARERGTDLMVIGAHRPELSDYLLGPNAARVVRHAGCSVLVVRD
ncbi:universal stress protein [Roseospira navarrensis]|uniref:Universal stress protein n=1 Tax=Roseospira navarrensis TaxID=140058 RepID=A0A7X1ZGF7_9PROT|nr:universal stress protein [Roseospira navarrensis]MQX37156.1 universal stress protein [Roseospira navarrensis]